MANFVCFFQVSVLGGLCMHEPGLADAILMTVFNGIHWPDTASSVAFCRLAQMLINRLARKDDCPLNSEAVKYIMQSVLWGLKVGVGGVGGGRNCDQVGS